MLSKKMWLVLALVAANTVACADPVDDFIADKMSRQRIPDLMPMRQTAKVSSQVLDGYAGVYQAPGGPMRKLVRRGDKLALAIVEGNEMPEIGNLRPESETHLFNEEDTRPTYSFVHSSEGMMQLVVQNAEGKEVMRLTRQDQ